MVSNGPAVKFSRRYLEKLRPQRFIFSHKVVPVQDRDGAVIAKRVLTAGRISVLQYKVIKYSKFSYVPETLNREHEICRGTNIH